MFDFERLISARAVDVVQPDLTLCGGLDEARAIAVLCRLHNVGLSPHVWGSPVGLAAALHFMAALPDYPHTDHLPHPRMVEYDVGENPLRDHLLAQPLRPVDGHIPVPDGPGPRHRARPGRRAALQGGVTTPSCRADRGRSPGSPAPSDMARQQRLLAARLALFYAAYFAAVGIYLPFWPVWLESQGLGATEIGYVLAAAFWPRIATNLLIPSAADRLGERRRPMILLTAVTLGGLVLFGLARDFWPLLLLSLLTGATWATILPLGEALALGEAKRGGLDYGRIRLWGSLTFILAAIAVGDWLERAAPPIILWSIAAMVACLLAACVLLPPGECAGRPAAATGLRRLGANPSSLPSSRPPACFRQATPCTTASPPCTGGPRGTASW